VTQSREETPITGNGNECCRAATSASRRTKFNTQSPAAAMRGSQGLSWSSIDLSPTPACRKERGPPLAGREETKKGRWLPSGPSLGRKRPRRAAVTQEALPHGEILGTGPHKMQEANHSLLTYSRTFFFGLLPSPCPPCTRAGRGRSPWRRVRFRPCRRRLALSGGAGVEPSDITVPPRHDPPPRVGTHDCGRF